MNMQDRQAKGGVWRPALSLLLLLTLITGVAYPLLVTGLGQLAFPLQANGSLVRDQQGQVRGSSLIGQAFEGPGWFAPRPSAGQFATLPSAASNLSAGNPALAERIAGSAKTLWVPGGAPVPLALLTTSASGVDPHLPPAAVDYQAARVAAARGLPVEQVRALIEQQTERPWLGPPVVNVLALNLALDRLSSSPH